MFTSPNAQFFVAATALVLGLFNSAAVAALWIFYLSKQFSTHSVKVLDLKHSVAQRKPHVSSSFEVDGEGDEEKEIKDFATSTVAAMFGKKERFNDPLT